MREARGAGERTRWIRSAGAGLAIAFVVCASVASADPGKPIVEDAGRIVKSFTVKALLPQQTYVTATPCDPEREDHLSRAIAGNGPAPVGTICDQGDQGDRL